jgi:hypothetical protein
MIDGILRAKRCGEIRHAALVVQRREIPRIQIFGACPVSG